MSSYNVLDTWLKYIMVLQFMVMAPLWGVNNYCDGHFRGEKI